MAGEHDVVTSVTTTHALLTNRSLQETRPLFHRMEGSSLEAHDLRNGAGRQKEEERNGGRHRKGKEMEGERQNIYGANIQTHLHVIRPQAEPSLASGQSDLAGPEHMYLFRGPINGMESLLFGF